MVILFAFKERFEVGLYLVFEIFFHGDGFESRRTRERNRTPPFVALLVFAGGFFSAVFFFFFFTCKSVFFFFFLENPAKENGLEF